MSEPRHVATARMMLDTMTEDPDGGEALGLAYAGIRTGRWGAGYTAAIGQSERHGTNWPMEQVAAFAMVHSKLMAGDAAQVMISTRATTPEPDAERETNAAALADLPRPFRAKVDLHQDKHPGDGMLYWDESIRVTAATGLIERGEDGETFPLPLTMMIPPGEAILEIGTTLASRTWTHIEEWGGVARWPYGEPFIYLFVNLGPTLSERIAEMIPRKNPPAPPSRPRCPQHPRRTPAHI